MHAPKSPVVDAVSSLLQAHRQLREALLAEDISAPSGPTQYPDEHRRRSAHRCLDSLEETLLDLADLYGIRTAL